MNPTDLLVAIDAILAGDWHRAHGIVQRDEREPLACWIHAVLHKIEGDAWNSRNWYARSGHDYDEYPDACVELAAIRARLASAAVNRGFKDDDCGYP